MTISGRFCHDQPEIHARRYHQLNRNGIGPYWGIRYRRGLYGRVVAFYLWSSSCSCSATRSALSCQILLTGYRPTGGTRRPGCLNQTETLPTNGPGSTDQPSGAITMSFRSGALAAMDGVFVSADVIPRPVEPTVPRRQVLPHSLVRPRSPPLTIGSWASYHLVKPLRRLKKLPAVVVCRGKVKEAGFSTRRLQAISQKVSGLTETGPRYQHLRYDSRRKHVARLAPVIRARRWCLHRASSCAIPEQLLRKITTRSLFAALIPPSGFNQISFVPLAGVTRREGN